MEIVINDDGISRGVWRQNPYGIAIFYFRLILFYFYENCYKSRCNIKNGFGDQTPTELQFINRFCRQVLSEQ